MDIQEPSFKTLFDQLGLPSSPEDIEAFIEAHRPLDAEIILWKAPFWTTAQAQFLRDGIKDDADWAPVVDRFDTRLRKESLSN